MNHFLRASIVKYNSFLPSYYLIITSLLIYISISDQQIGLMLNRDLQFSYRDFAQDLLTACDQNPKLADVPIQVSSYKIC